MVSATDTFTRANSTTVLGTTETGSLPWVQMRGVWGISSNQAYLSTSNANSVAAVDLGSADMTVEATMPVRSSGSPVLAVRITDFSNWIGYQATNSAGTLLRAVNGTYFTTSSIAPTYLNGNNSASLPSAAGDVMKLVASGSLITLYKNNVAICQFTDNTTGTYGGFRTDGSTARFDDFSASSAAAGSVLTNTVAPAITGTATTGQTLPCSTGTWSATPDSYAYAWKRAGVAISGATAATYALQVADEGQAITCTVTATKATYTAGSATSNSVTPAADPTTLTNTAAPAITGTAVTGQTLTVSNGTWSATPDSYTYVWKRAGSAISGATASTYVLVQADEGQAVTATVTAVKAGYTGGVATSNTVTPTSGLSLTNTTLPTLSGLTTLTATTGTWSATPDSYAYQWKRAGANISGATSSTYVLVAADVGSAVTCTVTAVKAGYATGTATTAATVTVVASLPGGSVTPKRFINVGGVAVPVG